MVNILKITTSKMALILIPLFAWGCHHRETIVRARIEYNKSVWENLRSDQEQKASRGDSEAQLSIARDYGIGLHGEQDYEKSLYWLRRAAKSGNTSALTPLEKAEKFLRSHKGDRTNREFLDQFRESVFDHSEELSKAIQQLNQGIAKVRTKSNYAERDNAQLVLDAIAKPSKSDRLVALRNIYAKGELPFNFKQSPLENSRFLNFLESEGLTIDRESGYVFFGVKESAAILDFERKEPSRIQLHKRLTLPFVDEMSKQGFYIDDATGMFLHRKTNLKPLTNEDAWKYHLLFPEYLNHLEENNPAKIPEPK